MLTFRNGDRELRHAGEFTAQPGTRSGTVVRHPGHPAHFKWSASGRHFFSSSTTAYWLLGFRDEAVIRGSIDRLDRLGVTRSNPRSGESASAGVAGGHREWVSPPVPGTGNWVWLLNRP